MFGVYRWGGLRLELEEEMVLMNQPFISVVKVWRMLKNHQSSVSVAVLHVCVQLLRAYRSQTGLGSLLFASSAD